MAVNPGPHNLDVTRMILGPSGEVTPKDASPTFYEELDTEFDGFGGHILVQTGEFAEVWPTWEMHPHGDEIVYLIAGAVDFVLWNGGAEEVLRVDEPGTCVVVPRGTWHTARPLQPTRMLFVTPGEGTLNAERPGA